MSKSKLIGLDEGGYYTDEGYANVADLTRLQLTTQLDEITEYLDWALSEAKSDSTEVIVQFEKTVRELTKRDLEKEVR